MKSFFQEIVKITPWAVAALFVFSIGLNMWGSWHDEWSGYDGNRRISDGSCNIAVLPIIGAIIPYAGADEDGSGNAPAPSTSADHILNMLRLAEREPDVRGILVRIDSQGGSPVASEIMADGFRRSTLPVAALVRETGVSAAYLAATGAKTIIASPFSNVGGIGVTMSYLENTAKNAKEGLRYVPLASAPFKDYGDPDKPLTYAERLLIERDLKMLHEQFVKEVAENRNLPIEKVTKLADGSSMPGALALQKGLIDAVGDQETARAWFAEQLNIPLEEVLFCE